MIVSVFGASGRTGRAFVQLAGEAGLLQRLHFRSASNDPSPDTATVVVGALNDPTAVREVLRGAEAAVILYGPRNGTGKPFCATTTKAIIAGMRAQGVPRIICVTGATVGEQGGSVSLAMKLLSFGARRAGQDAVMADREAQERHVRNSKLQWTLVKPPRLTDEPGTELEAGPTVAVGLASHCSRQALSRFLVKELMQPQYLESAVYVKDR